MSAPSGKPIVNGSVTNPAAFTFGDSSPPGTALSSTAPATNASATKPFAFNSPPDTNSTSASNATSAARATKPLAFTFGDSSFPPFAAINISPPSANAADAALKPLAFTTNVSSGTNTALFGAQQQPAPSANLSLGAPSWDNLTTAIKSDSPKPDASKDQTVGTLSHPTTSGAHPLAGNVSANKPPVFTFGGSSLTGSPVANIISSKSPAFALGGLPKSDANKGQAPGAISLPLSTIIAHPPPSGNTSPNKQPAFTFNSSSPTATPNASPLAASAAFSLASKPSAVAPVANTTPPSHAFQLGTSDASQEKKDEKSAEISPLKVTLPATSPNSTVEASKASGGEGSDGKPLVMTIPLHDIVLKTTFCEHVKESGAMVKQKIDYTKQTLELCISGTPDQVARAEDIVNRLVAEARGTTPKISNNINSTKCNDSDKAVAPNSAMSPAASTSNRVEVSANSQSSPHVPVTDTDRIEKEKIEKDRIEKEKIDKDRIEKDKIDKDRIEKEKAKNSTNNNDSKLPASIQPLNSIPSSKSTPGELLKSMLNILGSWPGVVEKPVPYLNAAFEAFEVSAEGTLAVRYENVLEKIKRFDLLAIAANVGIQGGGDGGVVASTSIVDICTAAERKGLSAELRKIGSPGWAVINLEVIRQASLKSADNKPNTVPDVAISATPTNVVPLLSTTFKTGGAFSAPKQAEISSDVVSKFSILLSPKQYVETLKIDEDELDEVEDEIAKAIKAWESTIKAPEMINFATKVKEVEKLLRAIGTNYKDDVHGVELKAIAKKSANTSEGGVMSKEQFVDWYVRWMFTPEDTEGLDSDVDAEPNVDFNFKLADFKAKEAVEGETWKCSTCKIMNKWLSGYCKGCELKAPHFATLPEESRKAPAFAAAFATTMAPMKSTGPKITFGSTTALSSSSPSSSSFSPSSSSSGGFAGFGNGAVSQGLKVSFKSTGLSKAPENSSLEPFKANGDVKQGIPEKAIETLEGGAVPADKPPFVFISGPPFAFDGAKLGDVPNFELKQPALNPQVLMKGLMNMKIVGGGSAKLGNGPNFLGGAKLGNVPMFAAKPGSVSNLSLGNGPMLGGATLKLNQAGGGVGLMVGPGLGFGHAPANPFAPKADLTVGSMFGPGPGFGQDPANAVAPKADLTRSFNSQRSGVGGFASGFGGGAVLKSHGGIEPVVNNDSVDSYKHQEILYNAAEMGDLEKFDEALGHGADLNYQHQKDLPDWKDFTPIAKVRRKKQDQEEAGPFGKITSSTNGHRPRQFGFGGGLGLGESPESSGFNTVLHVACWKGRYNIVARIFKLMGGSPAVKEGTCTGTNSEVAQNGEKNHPFGGSNSISNVKQNFSGFSSSFISISNSDNLTPLQLATLGGHVEVMKLCLSKDKSWNINSDLSRSMLNFAGGPVNFEFFLPHMSPLHIAASQGRYEITKLLLEEEGYSPDYRDSQGMTPLHYASMYGRRDIAELLFAKKCDINAASAVTRLTSLHFASKFGQTAMVELLFDQGADASLYSCENADNGSRNLFHDIGPELQVLEKSKRDGFSAFQEACHYGHKDIVDLFIAKKKVLDFEEKGHNGFAALHIASVHGHEEIVATLLDNVTNSEYVNCRNDALETPLILACRCAYDVENGKKNVVAKLLLERGADPNLADDENRTPLHYAALNTLEEIADILVSKGAILDVKTFKYDRKELQYVKQTVFLYMKIVPSFEVTPLYLAAMAGSKQIASLILDDKATASSHNKAGDGLSPLHVACRNGHHDVVDVLLRHGADLKERTTSPIDPTANSRKIGLFGGGIGGGSFGGGPLGSTPELLPIHLAALGCHKKVVELLLDRGAAVTDEDDNGKTALHMAVEFLPSTRFGFGFGATPEEVKKLSAVKKDEQIALVQMLLERGFDPQKRSKEDTFVAGVGGQNALQLAVKNFQSSVKVIRSIIEKDPSLLQGGHLLHKAFTSLKLSRSSGGGFGVIENGVNVDVLGLLLDKAPDLLNEKGLDGETFFYYVINDNKECKDLLEFLLKRGADPNQRDKDNISPLEWALYYGYEDSVNLLLNHGANPLGDENGDASPLHIACANGNKRIVEKLLEHGCDPNKNDKNGRSSFQVAIANDKDEIVRILISKIVNPIISIDPHSGQNPLHWSCNRGLFSISELLLNHPSVDANTMKDILQQRGANNETPLGIALKKSHIKMVKMLLEKGADPNEKDINGKKYIENLCQRSSKEIFEVLLLQASVDPDEKFEGGHTALHLCVLNGRVGVIEVLLARGCDVNVRNLDGKNCLQLAIERNNDVVAALLIPVISASFLNEREIEIKEGSWQANNQASHNLQSLFSSSSSSRANCDIKWLGRSPLHWAAGRCSTNTTSLLLRHGAKVDSKDENGDTPLHLALRLDTMAHKSVDGNPVEKTISLLIGHNASHSDKNNAGVTPFFDACKCLNKEAILLFLDKGADPREKSVDGNTALHFLFPNFNERYKNDATNNGRGVGFGSSSGFGGRVISTNPCASGVGQLIDESARRLDIVEILLKEGCDPNHKNNADNLPLMLAFQNIRNGEEDVFDLLLALVDKSKTLLISSFLSGAPLHWAIRSIRLETVRRILELGATFEEKDESGFTPLMVACLMALDSDTSVAKDILHLLLSKSTVDINAKDGSRGQTALHVVASYRKFGHFSSVSSNNSNSKEANNLDNAENDDILMEVFNLLVSMGGDIKAKDSQDDTPLHFAALRGDLKMVEMLLASKVDCNAKNKFGITPLYLACCCSAQNIEVITLLVKHKADVTCKETSLGWTPLHAAISNRSCDDTLKVLLERARHLAFEKDNIGQTPVHLACSNISSQLNFLNSKNKRNHTMPSFPTAASNDQVPTPAPGSIEDPYRMKLNCSVLELLFQNGASANITTTVAFAVKPTGAFTAPAGGLSPAPAGGGFFGFSTPNPREWGNNPLHLLFGSNVELPSEYQPPRFGFSPFTHGLYAGGHIDLERLSNVGNGRSLLDVTNLLIKNGCSVDGINSTGKSPFLMAVQEGDIDVIAALVAKGCDTNVIYNFNGDSALHFVNGMINNTDGMNPFASSRDRHICRLSPSKKLDIFKFLLVNGSFSPCVRNSRTGETIVQRNKAMHSHPFGGPLPKQHTRSDKISDILRRWPLCMCVIAFEELLISQYDTESFKDLFEFIGEEADYLQDNNNVSDPPLGNQGHGQGFGFGFGAFGGGGGLGGDGGDEF